MRRLFVDTSAYFALTDKRDENHEAAVRFIHQLIKERAELLTTNYIVAETHTLLLNRIGYATELQVLDELYKSQTRIYRVRECCLNQFPSFFRLNSFLWLALWRPERRIDSQRGEAEVTHNISAPVLPLFLDHDPSRKTL